MKKQVRQYTHPYHTHHCCCNMKLKYLQQYYDNKENLKHRNKWEERREGRWITWDSNRERSIISLLCERVFIQFGYCFCVPGSQVCEINNKTTSLKLLPFSLKHLRLDSKKRLRRRRENLCYFVCCIYYACKRTNICIHTTHSHANKNRN